MRIRLADHRDLETLVQVRLDFIREIFEPQLDSEIADLAFRLRAYYVEHLERDFTAVLAEDGTKLAAAAFFTVTDRPPNPRISNGRLGQITNVLTYPEYRHQGLATALIQKILEEAARRGVSRVELAASADGRPVYEKLGFVEDSGHTHMHLILARTPTRAENA